MSTDDIVFPRKWNQLTEDEQKEWINSYFMPKTKIPEPILAKTEKIAKATFKLQSGTKIQFPKEKIAVTRSNPNIVREFEEWVDKWLVTVFHDKNNPHIKYLSIGNASSGKWIAQELSPYIWRKLYGINSKIGHKYRFYQRKKPKSERKKRDFPLSLRDNIERRKQ